MKYAILVGEKLIYAKDYYFCNIGELITNFNKDIEAMTRQGFKVVVDEKPEYDKDLQSLSIVGYEETDDSIKIIYEVLNTPEPKPTPTLEYVRETLERQLTTYLRRGRLNQAEYDELIALMDARELVTEEEK